MVGVVDEMNGISGDVFGERLSRLIELPCQCVHKAFGKLKLAASDCEELFPGLCCLTQFFSDVWFLAIHFCQKVVRHVSDVVDESVVVSL